MFNYTAAYTDLYQIFMSQVYYNNGVTDETAIFDYFFRVNPFKGGYVIFAGLEDLLQAIENLRFAESDLDFLKTQDMDKYFLEYLRDFRFRGTIYAPDEGDITFPIRPTVIVKASIIEAQILETLLLNILNYQSLIATKASRMRLSAGDRKLIDFGLRRAPGTGGYSAARAAIIGGFDATSNVYAARDYSIPVSGTMGHSFVQRYHDELTAFRHFAEIRPNNCVLLVDTYNTLNSGVPNAITVGKEMAARGEKLTGIRLDSGDLAWLAKKSRKMLDDAGLHEVKISASNQLDEYVIRSLVKQEAPIDYFGVGTSLVTGFPDAALDGVYKLAYANNESRLKLSENIEKINLPAKKQVYRLLNKDGSFYGGEVVTLMGETDIDIMYHPTEPHKVRSMQEFNLQPLLKEVMVDGERVIKPKKLSDIASFSKQQLNKLPGEYKRFEYPHIYKIGLSKALKDKRDRLVHKYREKTK